MSCLTALAQEVSETRNQPGECAAHTLAELSTADRDSTPVISQRRVRRKLDPHPDCSDASCAPCWAEGLPAVVCQAVFSSLCRTDCASSRLVCRRWHTAASEAQTELCLTPVPGGRTVPQGLIRAFPQLRSVRWIDGTLGGVPAPVTGALCVSLAAAASTLTGLDLSDCCSFGDADIAELSCMSNLRCLDLASTQVTDVALGETLSSLPCLTELNLCGCPDVTDRGIEALCLGRVATSLTSLNLSSDLLERETECVNSITDQSLASLSLVKNLRYLNLSGAQGVTSVGLPHLSSLTGLVSLNLSRTQLDDSCFHNLSGLSRLSTLCLSHTSVADSALDIIARLPSMTYLDLVGCDDVSDTGLTALGSHGLRLQYLNVSDCAEVTDKGLKGLSEMSSLSTFCLGSYVCEDYLHVTDEGLRSIGRLTNLTKLDLHECSPDITRKGVEHLQSLAKLQALTLARCPGICDRSLGSIGSLRSLQFLDLYGCRGITASGVVSLQGLPLLQELRLPKSKQIPGDVVRQPSCSKQARSSQVEQPPQHSSPPGPSVVDRTSNLQCCTV